VLCLLALLPSVVVAQKTKEIPKRPPLAAGDTNDAHDYYEAGLLSLRRDPQLAADAFYWSARLDPLNADAFYARRVALLLTQPRRLELYWEGDKGTLRNAEVKAIDSLYLYSLTLNPFFYEKLERSLQDAVIQQIVHRETATSGGAGELEYEINQYLATAGWGEKAFRAYSDGDFTQALDSYAKAIKQASHKYYYRQMRGRLFFQLGHADSALTELKLALEEMRKRDQKDLVYVYQSKALLEQSIGMAYESLGDKAAAKEAYARALQEDLAYSPAHVRLAYMALEAKDTATAVSEFDLAVQLRPNDAGLRHLYGSLLVQANKAADAEPELRKAIELNPDYAGSYHALGLAYEQLGKPADAVTQYREFLARSSKRDIRRGEAERKIQTLASK